MGIKFRNIYISKSVLKNTLLIATFILILYIGSVLFSLNILKYNLNTILDSRIRHEIEHISSAIRFEKDSLIIIRKEEFNETDLVKLSEDPFLLQIYLKEGKILLQSKNLAQFGKIEIERPDFKDKYYFKDAEAQGLTLRIGYQKIYEETGNHIGYIQLALLKTGFNKVIQNIVFINLFTFPFVVILIMVVSFWISKKIFSPINNIITLARNISASNLDQRLTFDADPKDELGKLKDTLNDLFNRLEIQIKQISDFTNNASHQLMTPLTAINTELEFLLRGDHDREVYKESITLLKEQTERMIHIVKALLLLSKDTNLANNQKSVFNLSKVLKEYIREYYNNYKIELDVKDNIYLRGRPDYFLLALQNLIDNALKYSNNDWVTIKLTNDKEKIILRIEDFGIGIQPSEKEKIFERFYRSEKAELLGIKGYGLGLSLVKFIIQGMNGTISVMENKPKGTVFIITFPSLKII